MTGASESRRELDRVIVGRSTPSIYAFTTPQVAGYLKVGFTQRAVSTRLREWQEKFPDLKKRYEADALITNDVYFLDHSVHVFLMNARRRERLEPSQVRAQLYSREFFRGASPSDVADAISDIKESHTSNPGKYEYYDASGLKTKVAYDRGPAWTLRPNQKRVVESFSKAVAAGRTNLLMFAVMRFGKSFTSLCCAEEIGAKVVLVVSGKKDVGEEWKFNVERAGNFPHFTFLVSSDLDANHSVIRSTVKSGQTAVVFLTLQDLQGDDWKEKHRELTARNMTIDLLIVDETHFGARGKEFGKKIPDAERQFGRAAAEKEYLAELEDGDVEQFSAIQRAAIHEIAPMRTLHLSGTPYQILMGDEFGKEDIIAAIQFSDIVEDQKSWDEKHRLLDSFDESENPYFGFPQMIRFAFNPSSSARQKMEDLRKAGFSFALSALLEPQSITIDNRMNGHRKFKHENEVLEMLYAIDGTKTDDSVFGFLDYDKIQTGQMCRHMVVVLPYRASCDSLEALLMEKASTFKNLGSYKVINISGLTGPKLFKQNANVKSAIEEAESQGQKTITLTVNRMLTGSTVKQWDTMLFMKDTASPQEYDQAIFRLQNQYVQDFASGDGSPSLRINMKPQTLLVDFSPDRLFRMQETKSMVDSILNEKKGNDWLQKRIAGDLVVSPLLTMTDGKIKRVDATDVINAISRYSRERSLADEARGIPYDRRLLLVPQILAVIESQPEIGSRQGLTMSPHSGSEEDLKKSPENGRSVKSARTRSGSNDPTDSAAEAERKLERKLQTYYQRVLFYALLCPKALRSLREIVSSMDSEGNSRIAMNLGLDSRVLASILQAFDPLKLSRLDYAIQNVSHQVRDESLHPLTRAYLALEKFSRISDSEVRTPLELCTEVINTFSSRDAKKLILAGHSVLDVASKSGEFAVALYKYLTEELALEHSLIRDRIISIPTSGISYEFTRKFYEILGLNTDNILMPFREGKTWVSPENARDSSLAGKKFAIIVGNPPYQMPGGGGGVNDTAIYHLFVQQAMDLNPRYISMIIPSRWMSSGRGLENFRNMMLTSGKVRKIVDYPNTEEVFPGIQNEGGVCYFLWDREKMGPCEVVLVRDGAMSAPVSRQLDEFDVFIRDSRAVPILQKVLKRQERPISEIASADTPFGLPSNFRDWRPTKVDGYDLPYFHLSSATRKWSYVSSQVVKKNTKDIMRWKVFVPLAHGGKSLPAQVLGKPEVGGRPSVCSQTFRYFGPFKTKAEAQSFESYLGTRFFRFLVSLRKNSQNTYRDTYAWVPQLEWNRTWTDADLYVKYGITKAEQHLIRELIKEMPT